MNNNQEQVCENCGKAIYSYDGEWFHKRTLNLACDELGNGDQRGVDVAKPKPTPDPKVEQVVSGVCGIDPVWLKAPEPTGDEKANRCEHGVWASDHCYQCSPNEGNSAEPKAPDVTEVVLPPLMLTIEDADFSRKRGYLGPETLVYTMLAARERQLKTEILLRIEAVEIAGRWLNDAVKAEKERDEWRNKAEAAIALKDELETSLQRSQDQWHIAIGKFDKAAEERDAALEKINIKETT